MIDAAIARTDANRSCASVLQTSRLALSVLVRSPSSLSPSMHLRPSVRPCQSRRNPSSENFIGQVPPLAPAKRAHRNHPRVWNRGHGCRNVLSTFLASHREVAHPFRRAMKHGASVGEQKANLFHKIPNFSRSKPSGPRSRAFQVFQGGCAEVVLSVPRPCGNVPAHCESLQHSGEECKLSITVEAPTDYPALRPLLF
jgi:hypothetical protein